MEVHFRIKSTYTRVRLYYRLHCTIHLSLSIVYPTTLPIYTVLKRFLSRLSNALEARARIFEEVQLLVGEGAQIFPSSSR